MATSIAKQGNLNIYIAQYSVLGMAKLLRIPAAMLITALLSRLVGPEGVGKWSMIVAVSAFFHSVFLGWTQAQAVRIGRSEWLDSGRLSATWSARRRFVIAALMLSAALLAFRPFSFFESLTELPSSWSVLALAYLLGIWWIAESQILMQTTGKIVRLSLLPLVLDMSIVAYMLVILLAFQRAELVTVIGGIVAITVLVGGASWLAEFVATRSRGGETRKEDTVAILSYGGPVAIAAFMGYLSDWGDHFLLQHFHGPIQVGLFQAGYQAMIAMIAMAGPISVIFLPKLVDTMRQDPNMVATYAIRTVPLVATIWLLFLIPCIAFVPWLFGAVFGLAFREAQPVFLVLCIAVPGAAFSYLYSVLFNVQGRSGRMALYIGLMTLVNFIVSISLIPDLGSMGAAVGTAISYILVQMLCMADQHRFLSVKMTAAACLFVIGAAFGLMQSVIGEHLVGRVGLAAIWMGLVVVAARGLRIFQPTSFNGILPARFTLVSMILARVLVGK